MRDIRADLKERLAAIELEAADLRKKLDALGVRKQSLQLLLEQENDRWRDDSRQVVMFANKPPTGQSPHAQFSNFLRGTLADKNNWSLEELKMLAIDRGLDFEGKHPGRVLHFALLGMAQNGIVQNVERGVWKLKEEVRMNGAH